MRVLPSNINFGDDDGFAQYGGMDVAVTLAAHNIQSALLDPGAKFIERLEMAVTPIYTTLGLRGLRVDEERAREVVKGLKRELDEIVVAANTLVRKELGWPEDFNLLSNHQLMAALYGPLEPPRCPLCDWTGKEVTQHAHIVELTNADGTPALYKSGQRKGQRKVKEVKRKERACKARHTYPGCACIPYKHPKTGNPTVDEDALSRLIVREEKRAGELVRATLKKERKYTAAKLAQMRLDAIELRKEVEFYVAPRMPNGRFPFEIKCGTDTLRTSATSNAYGEGCLPGDAEVLTKSGWKRFDRCEIIEEIAQWRPDGKVLFAKSLLHKSVSKEFISGSNHQIDWKVTPGHTMPWFTRHKKFKTSAAKDIAHLRYSALPVSGVYRGDFALSAPRLWVAALADGHREANRFRVQLKKERKQKRFVELCDMYGIKYWYNKAKDGYKRFVFNPPADWPEDFGEWILNLSHETAVEMLEEFGYWDGTRRGLGYVFYSARERRADWVATLAHLHGYSATKHIRKQSKKSWSDTTMYCVKISPRSYKMLYPGKSTTEVETDVYCFHTVSGFFLVRQNGCIWVSGNSNLQQFPRPRKSNPGPRAVVLPDEGYELAAYDLGGAESYAMAHLAMDMDDIRAHEQYSPHCAVARAAWPENDWRGDTEHDKRLAKSITLSNGWDLYDTAKRLRHGSQRYQSATGAARTLKCSVKEAQVLLDKTLYDGLPVTARFMERFKDGLSYWRHMHVGAFDKFGDTVHLEKVDGTGPTVTVHLGNYHFSRTFSTPPRDAGTARDAISFVLQAIVRVNLWVGLLRVWRDLDHRLPITGHGDFELLIDKHDELIAQVRDRGLLSKLRECMLVTMPVNGLNMTIPVEGEVGMKWSDV